MQIQLSIELLRDSGIPDRFWPYGADSYPGLDDALTAAKAYIKSARAARRTGVGIFFSGPSQSCKTFLGTFILKCLIVRGYNVRYETLPELMRVYIGDADTKHSMRQLYGATIDFLFIDDVNGGANRGEVNGLIRLLSLRERHNLPVILASRLPLFEFGEHYTADAASKVTALREISCDASTSAFAANAEREKEKRAIWEDFSC